MKEKEIEYNEKIIEILSIIIDDIPNYVKCYNISIILNNYLYNEYRNFIIKMLDNVNSSITFLGYNLINQNDLDKLNIEGHLLETTNDYIIYDTNIGYVFGSKKQEMLAMDYKIDKILK